MASAVKLITVVGDEVILHVESEEAFAPDVEVDFQNVPVDTGPRRDPNSPIPKIFFTEKLVAVAAPLGDPPQGKVGAAIKWKVNLNKDPTLESDTAVLVATVRGRTLAGARQVASVRELLFVQAIQVTTEPKLTRIMLHEFAKPDPAGQFVFDAAPAEQFVQSLSLQQKKLLCDTAMRVVAEQGADSSKPKGKLVLLITLYDPTKKSRLMCADNLEGRQAIRANATFSVFHCGDPAVDGTPPAQRGIVLVLHTEFFVVNMANTHQGGTSAWIRTNANGLTPNQYMDKANPKPVRYHVAALRPAGGTDIPTGTNTQTGLATRGADQYGVIWHGFYDSKGKNIMPGNTLHGMINTHGCWMLFRNYNWPESIRNDCEIVYRSVLRRERKLTANVEFALDVLGYDVHTDLNRPALDSSFSKFASFDRNYAFLWFAHEILGIKYFSHNHVRRGRRDEVLPVVDGNTRANDLDTHGKRVPFLKQFPLTDPSRQPKFTAPDEAGFTYFDPSVRKTHDPAFQNTAAGFDALFVDNALGYRTSQGFVGFVADQLTAAEVKTRSWADVYFYREADVDLTKPALVGTTACVDTSLPTLPPARFVRPR